jgi:hypothetical protein
VGPQANSASEVELPLSADVELTGSVGGVALPSARNRAATASEVVGVASAMLAGGERSPCKAGLVLSRSARPTTGQLSDVARDQVCVENGVVDEARKRTFGMAGMGG